MTKLVKEGANVPVYVLEYLLGSYCASNDEEVIREGLETVKKSPRRELRPARREAEKVKSTIRERGSLKVIDKVTVTLNEKRDVYEALLENLGVKGVEVGSQYVKKFEKLLVGGIWCIVTLEYFYEEDQKGSPFLLRDLKPIQMPNLDLEELFEGRRAFTEEQWIDVLIRSTGHGADPLQRAGQVAPALPDGPAGREQLQPLRTRPPRHGQEPHLQGDQPQQHPDLGRPDDRGEPVLQHGPPVGGPGRTLGRGGLRRGGGHQLQGQGWRPDHEGLHGLRVVRPWP